MLVDNIIAHTVRRSNVVIRAEVSKGVPEIVKQTLVLIGNRNACRAGFPKLPSAIQHRAVFGDGIPIQPRTPKLA